MNGVGYLLDEWAWKPGLRARISSTLFLFPKPTRMNLQEAPHIGHLIKEELARQGRTVTWLAKQLECSRQNVYGIFDNRWIYTDLLLKISNVLDVDFFEVYSQFHQQGKDDK